MPQQDNFRKKKKKKKKGPQGAKGPG